MQQIDIRSMRSRNQMLAWIDKLELNYETNSDAIKTTNEEIISRGGVPIDYTEYLALKVLLGLNDMLFSNILESVIIAKDNNAETGAPCDISLKDFIPILMNDEAYHEAVEEVYNEMILSDDIAKIEYNYNNTPAPEETPAPRLPALATKVYNTISKANEIASMLWKYLESKRTTPFIGGVTKDNVSVDLTPEQKLMMLVYPEQNIIESSSFDDQIIDTTDRQFMVLRGITSDIVKKLKSLIYTRDIIKYNKVPKPTLKGKTNVPKYIVMTVENALVKNSVTIASMLMDVGMAKELAPYNNASIQSEITEYRIPLSSLSYDIVSDNQIPNPNSPLTQVRVTVYIAHCSLYAKCRVLGANELDSDYSVMLFTVTKTETLDLETNIIISSVSEITIDK